MPSRKMTVRAATRRVIREIFARLDYARLGPIYCDEGGDEFWAAKRSLCQRLGMKLANVLLPRLSTGGAQSLCGSRCGGDSAYWPGMPRSRAASRGLQSAKERSAVLNRACAGLPVRFQHRDAGSVKDRIDHLWLVSVLNDPERFPELSTLSYGRPTL